MDRATGTKQRVVDRARYEQRPKAFRRTRVIGKNGATQTFKKVGDYVITDRGSRIVEQEGFQS